MPEDFTIIYSTGSIKTSEILKYIFLTGIYHDLFGEIIVHKEALKKIKELNINVSGCELQNYADEYRLAHDLTDARQMHSFLENFGLTVEDYEAFCEAKVSTNLLKEHLAGEKEIEQYFLKNHADYDAAEISTIVVKEESLAKEIIMLVQEDNENFHLLARKYSVDESTKMSFGYMGKVLRKNLPNEFSAKIFNAEPGDILGPFQRNDFHQIFLVEEVMKAALDSQEVRKAIKDDFFRTWAFQYLTKGIKADRSEKSIGTPLSNTV